MRYENPAANRRYFYRLDGEGIRQKLVVFVQEAHNSYRRFAVPIEISRKIASLVGKEE